MTDGTKISEPDNEDDAISFAGLAYDGYRYWDNEGFNGPDTLDQVADAAWTIIRLLDYPEVNRQRLLEKLVEGQNNETGELLLAMSDKLYETLEFLDSIRLAARDAHRKPVRGRPPNKADLKAAYDVLVDYWTRTSGKQFTSMWDTADGVLFPVSDAAYFLHESLKKIDGERERLAQELRDLMQDTIRSLPGARRGRPKRT